MLSIYVVPILALRDKLGGCAAPVCPSATS